LALESAITGADLATYQSAPAISSHTAAASAGDLVPPRRAVNCRFANSRPRPDASRRTTPRNAGCRPRAAWWARNRSAPRSPRPRRRSPPRRRAGAARP